MNLPVKFKRLDPRAKLPNYAHPGDVGLDLYALEDCEFQPGERRIFALGFALEFPAGYAAIVKDKGSLPKNAGLHTLGGVFDAGYRGEYNVNLINLGGAPYQIRAGDKLAQLVVLPVAWAEVTEVESLSETSRGVGRFGS